MPADKCTPLGEKVAQLALTLGQLPEFNTLDAVVAEVERLLPGITRTDVADALTAYLRSQRQQQISPIQEQLTEIKKEAREDVVLRERIDALEEGIANLVRPATQRTTRSVSQAIAELRKQRDALTKQLDKLVPRERKPTTRAPKPEEQRIAERKERLRGSIDSLLQQLESGEFIQPTKREAATDAEIERLLLQKKELRRTADARIREMQPRGLGKTIGDVLNVPRAMLASADLSGLLRQGGFIALGNPARGASALVQSLKSFKSEADFARLNSEIKNRPNAVLYDKAGLELTEEFQEEDFTSRLIDRLYGIRRVIKGSERAFIAVLNKLRADTFDAMIDTLTINGTPTIEEAQAIARFINVATGRGDINAKFKPAVEALNSAFFSPRYATSRFQLLLGEPLWRGDARTRKLIAKEYGKYLLGFNIMFWLAKAAAEAAAGDDEEKRPKVELDPTSSDFLKIRVGNTRIDMGSGLLQPIVLGARIGRGERKRADGKIVKLRGEDKAFGAGIPGILGRFLRSKLAPGPGMALNLLAGENVVGEPMNVTTAEGVKNVALGTLVPLSAAEMVETFQEQDVPEGVILTVMEMLGIGLSTYGRRSAANPTQ